MEEVSGEGLFARQGGKWTKRKQVFSRWLPIDEYTRYIEPFLGGGSILLDAPIKKDTIAADTDTKVIRIFKDLQHLNIDAFVNYDFAPHSRARWNRERKELDDNYNEMTPTARFIKTMYVNCHSFNSTGTTYTPTKNNTLSQLKRHVGEYKERVKDVKFFKQSFTEIIPKYDSKNSFFYCDPPYYGTDATAYETGEIDHDLLFKALDKIKGYFLLSYNDAPFIRRLYKDYYITSFKNVQTLTGAQPGKAQHKDVVDLLISNYEITD